jgi:adenylate cyclase
VSQTRRLAAIFAADVAGYSRLMGADEEGTHERLKAHLRELVNPKIAEHRGRTVENTGDGFLAEFPSVVDAVRCAVEVQRGMIDREPEVREERRITFRIGVNLGDVIAEPNDIYGDGVNVAARLEALAEPGSIYISRMVRDQIRDKLPYQMEDLGERELKNIARPVRVYRVGVGAPGTVLSAGAVKAPLPLPDKPSIAVLPFSNMSGDPEQEFFADGIAEDIITAAVPSTLSRSVTSLACATCSKVACARPLIGYASPRSSSKRRPATRSGLSTTTGILSTSSRCRTRSPGRRRLQ